MSSCTGGGGAVRLWRDRHPGAAALTGRPDLPLADPEALGPPFGQKWQRLYGIGTFLLQVIARPQNLIPAASTEQVVADFQRCFFSKKLGV